MEARCTSEREVQETIAGLGGCEAVGRRVGSCENAGRQVPLFISGTLSSTCTSASLDGSSTVIIICAAAGGVVALLGVIVLYFVLRKRKQRVVPG